MPVGKKYPGQNKAPKGPMKKMEKKEFPSFAEAKKATPLGKQPTGRRRPRAI